MGAGNVSLVYLRWASLPDRPFRLLAYMALVSMDTDCPPRFWGGYPSLARALGRNTPDDTPKNPTDGERKARNADFEAVRLGMKVLLESGPVSILVPKAPGRSAVYALDLGFNTPGQAWSTPQADPAVHPRLTLATPQAKPVDLGGVGGETLQTNSRNNRGIVEETRSPKVTNSLANPAEEFDEKAELNRQLAALAAWTTTHPETRETA